MPSSFNRCSALAGGKSSLATIFCRAFEFIAFSYRSRFAEQQVRRCWLASLAVAAPLELGESPMHHTHGSSSFTNGRSYPLDASSTDIAYGEYSWEAAFEHERRTGKGPRRIPI